MYIFILGLIFRVLLNNIYIISDYLSQSYFICYSLLIIIIHELIDYFNINSFKGKIFMASNINKTEPYRELGLSNKSSSKNSPINSYILPTNRRITELKAEAKAESSSQETPLPLTEKDKLFTKYKDEFKEFYTTCRESIKLSNYELEKLNLKVAIAYTNGAWPLQVMEMLPEDIKPIYKEFLRKQRVNKMFASLNRKKA